MNTYYRYIGKTNDELKHNQIIQVIYRDNEIIKFCNPRTSKTMSFNKDLFDKYFSPVLNGVRC